MRTTLISLSLILVSAKSLAANDDWLAAINAKPMCNVKSVAELLNPIPLDEEIVFASLKAGCRAFTADVEKFKGWTASDGGSHSVRVSARYLNYFDSEVLSPLKASVDRGRVLNDSDVNADAIGFALSFAKNFGKNKCAGASKPEACSGLSDVDKAESQFVVLLTQSEKNKKQSGQDEILGDACAMLEEKHYYEGVIKNENEAGKISGVVDKQKLYEAGKVIAHHKEALAPLEKAFKKSTGQPLTLSKCPAKFQQ